MEDSIKLILDNAAEAMESAQEHTQQALRKINAGKATPAMLEGVKVECYGQMTPLNQVASINTPDARTLLIKPWDKKNIPAIEKGIIHCNHIDLNPQTDGENVILYLPPMTEERRKELLKQVKAEGEKGKVTMRNLRKDAKDAIKKLQKEGISEDAVKWGEDDLQKLTDKSIENLDTILGRKEKDVMEI